MSLGIGNFSESSPGMSSITTTIRARISDAGINLSLSASVYALLLVSVVYFISVAIYRLYFHPLAKVPGPWYAAVSSLWVLVNATLLRRTHAVEMLFEKYGPVVRVGPDEVNFLDMPTVKSVYSAATRLDKNPFFSVLRIKGVDHALSTLDHDEHAGRKRGYAPHYIPKNLMLYQEDIMRSVHRLVSHLKTSYEKGSPKHDMLDTYRRMLVQINAVHLFGDTYDPYELEHEPLSEAIHKFPLGALLSHTLPKWLYNFFVFKVPFDNFLRDLHNAADSIAEYVYNRMRVIRSDQINGEKDSEDERRPLLSRLMEHSIDPKRGIMTDGEIMSESVSHLMAASDSSGNTLSYISWELTRRPDVMAKLQEELDTYMPDPNVLPSFSVLQDLPYLAAVIREALRVYLPIPSPLERVAPKTSAKGEPFTIGGYFIPAGTVIATLPHALHRDTRLFPDPDKFDPDRWIVAATRDAPPHPITGAKGAEISMEATMISNFIPFGIGPRICAGQNLANMVLRFALAAIARNFDISAPPETTTKSMKPQEGIVLFPKSQRCDLIFTPREKNRKKAFT